MSGCEIGDRSMYCDAIVNLHALANRDGARKNVNGVMSIFSLFHGGHVL